MAVVNILLKWGADETAFDINGDSPKGLLNTAHKGRRCSQEDIDRVQQLLAGAPADRAWRRRGPLTMLRYRALSANVDADGEWAEGSDGVVDGVGERCKVAMSEDAACVGSGEGGQTSRGAGEIGHETIAVRREGFGGAVVRLVELKPEGVFRTVLEFL